MTDIQQPGGGKISRVAALKLVHAGGDAFRAGRDESDCPYPVGGDDPIGNEFRRRFWLKGYVGAQRV